MNLWCKKCATNATVLVLCKDTVLSLCWSELANWSWDPKSQCFSPKFLFLFPRQCFLAEPEGGIGTNREFRTSNTLGNVWPSKYYIRKDLKKMWTYPLRHCCVWTKDFMCKILTWLSCHVCQDFIRQGSRKRPPCNFDRTMKMYWKECTILTGSVPQHISLYKMLQCMPCQFSLSLRYPFRVNYLTDLEI